MDESASIICERAFEFASRVLKLCGRLYERGPSSRHVAGELMRCGPSIGANVEDAQEGQTKKDFIAKLSISRIATVAEDDPKCNLDGKVILAQRRGTQLP